MWQVGDATTHTAYLAALTRSHGYGTVVRSWYNGEQIGELTVGGGHAVADGSVKVSGTNRERRSLSLTAAEALWPTEPDALLSSFGVWLTVTATVTAAATTFPEIPVFAGRVMRPRRVRSSGQMSVTGADPMWLINRTPFEEIRAMPAGIRNADAIRILIVEVFPQATVVDLTTSTETIPAATQWDARAGSRGAAIDDLAASIGAEVFALPTAVWPGGQFVIRPIPSLHDPVAWVLPPPPDTVIEADEQSQGGETVVNRWRILVERPDQTPLSVPVTDDDPGSPTRYGGPMGSLTDFYSSPLILTEGQAQTVGQALLGRTVGGARTRKLTVIANPACEAGDVMAVPGDSVEYHIADEFEVPLSVEPPSMDITTRSTGGN